MSFSEIVLILLVSLVIFGPQELPVIAKKLAKIYSCIINFIHNFKTSTLNQIGLNEINGLKQELNTTLTEIRHQLNPLKNKASALKEDDLESSCYDFFYQPELDFEREPELFDDLT